MTAESKLVTPLERLRARCSGPIPVFTVADVRALLDIAEAAQELKAWCEREDPKAITPEFSLMLWRLWERLASLDAADSGEAT